jgi:Fur family ferric uptake transcriptional regulator
MDIKIDVQQTMKMGGHRNTKTRDALISIFESHTSPLSVPDIMEQLAQKNISVNKTTVYREIEKLVNHAMIKPIHFGDQKIRYEIAHREHHHHIMCVQCKRVDDVQLTRDLLSQEKTIAKSMNYKILDHSLEFFGVCKTCQ